MPRAFFFFVEKMIYLPYTFFVNDHKQGFRDAPPPPGVTEATGDIKPILDAIKGLVLADDSLVTDVVCRRRPLAGPFLVDPVSAVLADGLAGHREFLHVRVALSPPGGDLRFL